MPVRDLHRPIVDEYQRLAEHHRPRDHRQLAAACRELAATGLSVRDIAAALRLQGQLVAGLLAGVPEIQQDHFGQAAERGGRQP